MTTNKVTPLNKTAPQVAIYACGGTGMNLGPAFAKIVSENPLLSDKVKIYSVDTSKANHKPFHTDENTLVVGNGDGSGKRRDKNYAQLKECVPEILHKFPPARFNIMLAGLSGGSGSIIQGVLLSELLGANIPAMTVGVGSVDSEREVLNLNQSFMSFASIPKVRKMPAVVNYSEIGAAGTRGEVDRRVLSVLTDLSLVFACLAEKIDASDLIHFLDYPKVTNFTHELVALDMFREKVDLRANEKLFAVTTLATANMPTGLDPRPPCQNAGFLDDGQAEVFGLTQPLHYAIIGSAFDNLIARNKELLAQFESAASAYRPTEHLDSDTEVESDGNVI